MEGNMMTAEETVRALRTYAGNEQKNNGFDTMRDFDAAADLIESLQARLAASQQRERAAVEDLYMACKHSPCNNGICVKKNCIGNRIPCDFEWRGQQEAGEGERDGD